MVLLCNKLLIGIALVVSIYVVSGTCQTITQKINDLSKLLILDKTKSSCIHQTVVSRKHQRSKEFLQILSTSVDKLKNELLESLTSQNNCLNESEKNLYDIYNNLKNIINNINSIQCKKKIKKKGVMKKIKKYMTTVEPEVKKEEKVILENSEKETLQSNEKEILDDFDGWSYEHLQLMKQYYAEIQQELAEIRKLCPS